MLARESCHRIVQHHGHSLGVFPKDSAADVVQTFSNFLTLHLQAVASTQLQLRANLDALRIETDKQMFLKDISSHKLYTSESQSSTQHQCTNIAESTQQFKSFRESASVRLSESYPKITQLESHFSSLRTLIDSVQNVQDYVTSGPFSSMLQSQPRHPYTSKNAVPGLTRIILSAILGVLGAGISMGMILREFYGRDARQVNLRRDVQYFELGELK